MSKIFLMIVIFFPVLIYGQESVRGKIEKTVKTMFLEMKVGEVTEEALQKELVDLFMKYDSAAREALSLAEKVNNAEGKINLSRIVYENMAVNFEHSVLAVQEKAVACLSGLNLAGLKRSEEKAVKNHLILSVGCLNDEIELRKRWKELAQASMTRSRREAIGVAWAKMSKTNDIISTYVKAAGTASDPAMAILKLRELRKLAGSSPEPVIIGE